LGPKAPLLRTRWKLTPELVTQGRQQQGGGAMNLVPFRFLAAPLRDELEAAIRQQGSQGLFWISLPGYSLFEKLYGKEVSSSVTEEMGRILGKAMDEALPGAGFRCSEEAGPGNFVALGHLDDRAAEGILDHCRSQGCFLARPAAPTPTPRPGRVGRLDILVIQDKSGASCPPQPGAVMGLTKAEVISFKADRELSRALARVPNRSAFIRAAVEAALEGVCPLCQGAGTLSPAARRHWEEFARGHRLERCADCRCLHLVCASQPVAMGHAHDRSRP